MKTNKFLFLLFIVLSVLTGCSKTFEAEDVIICGGRSFNVELSRLLSEVLEIQDFVIRGDVSYHAKEALAIKNSYFEYDDFEEEHNFIDINNLPKNKYLTINSTADGGYKLFIQAKDIDGDGANYKYEKIILIHGQDSIVGKNITFLKRDYEVECDDPKVYSSRPCSGKIEKYHIEYGSVTKIMSMEATKNSAVWKEYFPNGNIKSESRIEDAAEWNPFDLSTDAFVTTSYFYNEDGTEDKVFMGREFAVYETNITSHIDNSSYYVILYPNQRANTKMGDLLIVSVSKNRYTSVAHWEGEYKYEIKGNQLYLSEGTCASSWVNDRKKVSMRHQEVDFSTPKIFSINSFCNTNLTAECNLLVDNLDPWDPDWLISTRRRFLRR